MTGHAAGIDDGYDWRLARPAWAASARLGQPIVLNLPMSQPAETCSMRRAGLSPYAGGGDRQSAATDAGAGVVATLATSTERCGSRGPCLAGADRRRRHRRHARGTGGASMTARAIIIGAPRSGSGKTSVTIGILRALTRRGLKVRGAKSGPDYIDPGFHTAATGLSGVNLDSWAMPPSLLNALAAQQADDTDFVILESAMGLFDGIPAAPRRTGSAADLARLYGLPVLLVLDVSGQSTTAAAVAKGFATYDPDVRMAGVVLNRLGSERHRRLSGDAIEAIGLPVVGAILRDPTLNLPERHLGLVQAGEYR